MRSYNFWNATESNVTNLARDSMTYTRFAFVQILWIGGSIHPGELGTESMSSLSSGAGWASARPPFLLFVLVNSWNRFRRWKNSVFDFRQLQSVPHVLRCSRACTLDYVYITDYLMPNSCVCHFSLKAVCLWSSGLVAAALEMHQHRPCPRP